MQGPGQGPNLQGPGQGQGLDLKGQALTSLEFSLYNLQGAEQCTGSPKPKTHLLRSEFYRRRSDGKPRPQKTKFCIFMRSILPPKSEFVQTLCRTPQEVAGAGPRLLRARSEQHVVMTSLYVVTSGQ